MRSNKAWAQAMSRLDSLRIQLSEKHPCCISYGNCIPGVMVPLSGYYPPEPWWPHHSFQCLQMGKKVSVRGGKRSSLEFLSLQDQETKKPRLCPNKPLITQQVNPKKIMEVSLGRWGTVPRVVTTILSCQVNTTSRRGIIQLGISFGWIFLLFSIESSQGPHSY